MQDRIVNPTVRSDHEHRRRRMRRRRRRAYIRSVYFLPSLATLGNAVCGFGAMYVATLVGGVATNDPLTRWLSQNSLTIAAYLIFLAMVFDALDGRLARFTRHTTDFGGQLDSLADVVSFGAAPAFLSLYVTHWVTAHQSVPNFVTRLIWAVAALYFSCAAVRLARFNVSNKHGEQHHFSFLGLPSPGAGGAVAAYILMQQKMIAQDWITPAAIAAWALPLVVLATGLLMVSNLRYPHIVNRYLRGKRSFARLLIVLTILLLLVVAHEYTIAAATLIYAFWGPAMWAYLRLRRKHAAGLSAAPATP